MGFVTNFVEPKSLVYWTKKFKQTVGFPTIPVQKIVETMARFVTGKKV